MPQRGWVYEVVMSSYSFVLPSDFADYEWEVMASSSFSEALMTVDEKQYRFNFYDAVRLGQEIESELEKGGMFFEPNLVIIRSVTKAEMKVAAEQLVRSGLVVLLTPE